MNNCKICQTPIHTKRIYCSNTCKFSDAELNKSRSRKDKNDPNKVARCKIDGKIVADEKNLGGHLGIHSKKVLLKDFDWNDWEIIDRSINTDQRWNCPHCDFSTKSKDGKDGGGWIGKHLELVHNTSKDQHVEQFPDDHILWPHKLKVIAKQNKIEAHEDNRVQCLECGEYFQKISNSHLVSKHDGLTMDEYKRKHPFAKVNSQELTARTREIYFSETGMSKVNPESKGEIEVKLFIQSLGFNTVKHKTGFFEIDVFVPDLKIGFEYHGLFHHSQFRGNHKKYRHSDNLLHAEENGIYLIQIFEDEWLKKQEIVKSRIRNILKVDSIKLYARKCEVRILTEQEVHSFLDANHLQGYQYATHNIGLVHNDEVVQCMTFVDINKRANGTKLYNEGVYENVRSCTKLNHSIVGGFERILKLFEDEVRPIQIVSFADRRWSSLLKEPFYIRLGFEFIGNTPNHGWVMNRYVKRMYRGSFTKPKIRKINPALFVNFSDAELTQEKMLEMLDYDIIWDCGNLKFVKNYQQNLECPIIGDIEENIDTENIVKDSRKRHPVAILPDDLRGYVKCQLCGDYYKIKGFATHLGHDHKIKNHEYIDQFGEYRPSIISQTKHK